MAAAGEYVVQRVAKIRRGVNKRTVRSKTMVAPFSIGVLSHAPCGHASGGVESAG
jgi:hypothetical protein